YQAAPFNTARITPGAPGALAPTVMETLALAVWVGLPQVTTEVLVTTVPSVRPELRVARNFTTKVAPGGSGGLIAPELTVSVEPAKLPRAGESFTVADWFT